MGLFSNLSTGVLEIKEKIWNWTLRHSVICKQVMECSELFLWIERMQFWLHWVKVEGLKEDRSPDLNGPNSSSGIRRMLRENDYKCLSFVFPSVARFIGICDGHSKEKRMSWMHFVYYILVHQKWDGSRAQNFFWYSKNNKKKWNNSKHLCWKPFDVHLDAVLYTLMLY